MRRLARLAFIALAGAATIVMAAPATASGAPSPPITIAEPPMKGWCDYLESFGDQRPGGRTHQGIDMFAAANAPLYAVSNGRITSALTNKSLGGNQLKLKRKDGTYFIYAHMSSFADGIELGVPVRAGDLLGYMGNTGESQGPHLHFEVHPWGGSAIDPTLVLAEAKTCGDRAARNAIASYDARHGTNTSSSSSSPEEPTETASAPASASSLHGGTMFDQPPLVYTSAGEYLPGGSPTGAKVVGYPGIPSDEKLVDLTFTYKGRARGWAAVWPCGERAGIEGGTPLNSYNSTETDTRLSIRPGDGGRVCFQSTGSMKLEITVNGYQR